MTDATTLRRGTTEVAVSAFGGKITSLRFEGRQWLIPAPGALPSEHLPGTAFNDIAMSGWDEMFPSITGGRYDDHGELWTQRWEAETNNEPYAVTQRAYGTSVGYRFQRTIRITPTGEMELDYDLEGSDSLAFPYLWAAHPLFVFPERSTVEIVEGATSVWAVDDPDRPVGTEWPGGRVQVLEWVPPAGHRKFWFDGSASLSWVRLRHPDGQGIEVAWAPEALPVCGMWVDNRGFGAEPLIAIEPSTGFFDDVDRAEANGTARFLAAGQRETWSISVRALSR